MTNVCLPLYTAVMAGMIDVAQGRKSAILLLLLCTSSFPQSAPVHGIPIQDASDPLRGQVEEIVQDERGHPVEDATVTATPPGPLGAILPNTKTDAKGRFRLAGLIPGLTTLSATKTDAFYADTSSGLWNVGPGSVRIELPKAGTVSGILLKLSPAGRLQVRAINDITGATVERFGVYLELADPAQGDRRMWGSNLANRWLVPTVPIRVRVEAAGYDSSWYSKEAGSGQPTPLVLAPRQTLAVEIRLRPSSK